MKGIYLTLEGKQEIETKIAELEKLRNESSSDNNDYYIGRIKELQEILSSATILPVEESWQNIAHSTTVSFYESDFPQGVIIQPKQ
jgi:transcription elongation GreA/GreB family factor